MEERVLVISDLHERYQKLDRCLFAAENHFNKKTFETWFLGDSLGVHENDNLDDCDLLKSLERLKGINALCVRGNWDNWILREDGDENPDFKHGQSNHAKVLKMRRSILQDSVYWDFIKSWQDEIIVENSVGDFLLTHGSPIKKSNLPHYELWETPITGLDRDHVRRIYIERNSFRFLAVGHTHHPSYFQISEDITWKPAKNNISVDIPENVKFVFNPGSLDPNGNSNGDSTALMLDMKNMSFCFWKNQQ